MGQKAHPRGLRLGIIETWDSKWFQEREYATWLHEDLEIQQFVKTNLARAGISKVEIERYSDQCIVHIHTARPGIVIGRRGAEVEKLTTDLEKLVSRNVRIVIEEIRRPELDAQLVAEGVALNLLRRTNFRSAIKRAVSTAMKMGAQGCKVMVSGRLGGAEMSRQEYEIDGRVPLHTLRARIDYGFSEANTTYGKIGVKVWIFKGEVIGTEDEASKEASMPGPARRRTDRHDAQGPRRRTRRGGRSSRTNRDQGRSQNR